MAKEAKSGAGAWAWTKRGLGLLGAWGLVFCLVTLGRLGVAFEYDEALVSSTPAFEKALAGPAKPFSAGFWSAVNRSYDLDRPKWVGYSLARLFRLLGFRVAILAARPSVDGEALAKDWRGLTARGRFVFMGDSGGRQRLLQDGRFVLFVGSTDSGIEEARKAGVPAIRALRQAGSFFKEDYRPGKWGEWVLPFSQY